MSNAELAADAVNAYRMATQRAYVQLRDRLRLIADEADAASELAGDAYHAEIQRIADTEAEHRAAAHQQCNVDRDAALSAFTQATSGLTLEGGA